MIDDGGPIHPTAPEHYGYDRSCYGAGYGCNTGMSLLDYFAGLAMMGMVSSEDGPVNSERKISGPAGKPFTESVAEFVARNAYEFAEAMLAERKRRMEDKP